MQGGDVYSPKGMEFQVDRSFTLLILGRILPSIPECQNNFLIIGKSHRDQSLDAEAILNIGLSCLECRS